MGYLEGAVQAFDASQPGYVESATAFATAFMMDQARRLRNWYYDDTPEMPIYNEPNVRKRTKAKMPYRRRRYRRGRRRRGRSTRLRPGLRRRTGGVLTRRKNTKRRRGLSRAATRAVKRICRRAMMLAKRSPPQKIAHTVTRVLTGGTNTKTYSWFPAIDATTAGYGVIDILKNTLPEIDGAVITYKDLTTSTRSTVWANTIRGYLKAEIANNYGYPVKITWYHTYCTDNTDNNNTPIDNFRESLDEIITDNTQTLTNDGETYPWNSINQWRRKIDHWKFGKKNVKVLFPGQAFTILHKMPKGAFSVRKYLDDNSHYQKGFTSGITLEYVGAIAHGTAADFEDNNVGYSDWKLDTVCTRWWQYNTGASEKIERMEVDNNYNVLSNPEIIAPAIDDITDVDDSNPA